MLNDLKYRIVDLFERRAKLYPSDKPGKLQGWFEMARFDAFRSILADNIKVRRDGPYTELKGEVVEVFSQNLTVVLGIYSDETLLWLDDHLNDDDFAEFIKREQLLKKLSNSEENLARIIIETKLNYLGWPVLIASPSDIPPFQDYLGEQARVVRISRLEKVVSRIHPLELEISQGRLAADFCVWTQMYGRVYNINCIVGTDSHFQYQGELIEEGVGPYITRL